LEKKEKKQLFVLHFAFYILYFVFCILYFVFFLNIVIFQLFGLEMAYKEHLAF